MAHLYAHHQRTAPLQTSPRRVRDLLRSAIRAGAVEPGRKLEEDALVKAFATSRNAVRTALQLLATEGLVSRQQRHGTIVVGPFVEIPIEDFVSPVGLDNACALRTDHQIVPSTEHLAARLATDDDSLGMIEHLLLDHDLPIGVRVAYYKLQYEQPARWEHCPDIRTGFEYVFGRPLGRVETTIGVTPCDDATSRLLGLAAGWPVLVREQLLFDDGGIPQELTFTHHRADRVSFTVAVDLSGVMKL